jgi:peptidoglycan/LPS O-acetylase OafA/YrhL
MTPSTSSPSIAALTGLRGYAALWVLVSHVSFTDSLSVTIAKRLDWKLANGVLRHEYLAVDLFFMLSGFVLTHAHARELDARVDRSSYVRFLLLRLARVYPLHIVALGVTLLLHLFVTPNLLPASNPGCFALHMVMMASWGFCTGVSWNAPAWSLSSEWLGYLVLPLVLICTAGLKRVRAQLAVVGTLVVLFVALFFSYLCFGEFQFETDYSNGAGASGRVLIGVILGSVLRRLYDQPSVRRFPWTLVFWLALPVAVAFMSDRSGQRLDNNPWAYLAVMLLTFAAACGRPSALLPLTSRVAIYLGEISYAIYIFHFPVLLALGRFLRPWLEAIASQESPAGAQLVALAAALVVIGVAALAHHTIEEPLRRRARRWIARAHPIGASRSEVGDATLGSDAARVSRAS